jgi:hypothetical protein
VPGQHVLVPARRRPGDPQRAGIPARHPPRPALIPVTAGSAGPRAACADRSAGPPAPHGATPAREVPADGAPAVPRWQRTTSISDDAYTGTALLLIIRTSDTRMISRDRAPRSSTSAPGQATCRGRSRSHGTASAHALSPAPAPGRPTATPPNAANHRPLRSPTVTLTLTNPWGIRSSHSGPGWTAGPPPAVPGTTHPPLIWCFTLTMVDVLGVVRN